MSTSFNPRIAVKAPNRNKFDLSYYTRLTSRMGELVPVLCKKIVPSDEFKVSISSITRLAPLSNPVYDRLRIDYDAFFVQNRIIDPQFKEFLTGGIGLYGETSTEGMQNITVEISANQFHAGSLFDYLGANLYNLQDSQVIKANAEPLLGYYKIYSDWYRNERFQEDVYSRVMNTLVIDRNFEASGTDLPTEPLRRNYFKDPFTTALAEPLIGGPIPIMNGVANVKSQTELPANIEGSVVFNVDNTREVYAQDKTGSDSRLFVDLSTVASNTVQQLNQMYALYKFFMRDTYNGNRYVEFVQSHFNVVVPDSTLERPLFLGRYTQNVAFSEIFQTSGSTGSGNTLGDYAGKGASVGGGFLFHEKFLEHGYLYIIMSIVPESTYFQGVDSKFFYGDRFDSFYFPEFQNIGDDVIPSEVLFHDASLESLSFDNVRSKPFGYQRRNWDLIWFKNEIHGDFLQADSMLNWTFARKFSSKPVLGDVFSKIPSINNPFTYQDDTSQNFFTDIYFDIQALRPVERYESITTH